MNRLYMFSNFYVRSLQQTLQGCHAFAEMVGKYSPRVVSTPEDVGIATFDDKTALRCYKQILEWIFHGKTIISKNGGDCQDLQELYDFIATDPLESFAFEKFHEDKRSLNNALTSVAIIVPDYIWQTADADRNKTPDYVRPCDLTKWEEELIVRMNRCGHAT